MGTDLGALVKAARSQGWADAVGSLDWLRCEARRLGWAELATRQGDSTVAELRPVAPEHAHPRSLSSAVGLGQQPLHTDGAHLRRPPDTVALLMDQPSSTATLLWSLNSKYTNSHHPVMSYPAGIDDGLFLLSSGAERFLSPARENYSMWRFDPGCTSPCDERARQVAAYFDLEAKNAYRYEWTGGQLLLIDNRATLHARAAVAEQDEGRLLVRVAFRTASAR